MKPKPPTIRTRRVAERIARRIVEYLNPEGCVWDDDELPERLTDVTEEIMRCGRPGTVISRLWKKQPPIDDTGERGTHPYGWEGLDEDCRAIATTIAREELARAKAEYVREFGALREAENGKA
jgi:hypothetical protein